MQYTAIAENPFAVLTAIVAPAILTNASSVLALGTSNRLARVVDRTRVVAAELDKFELESPEYQMWAAQLEPLGVRTQLLVKALRLFYAGLGLFASSALVSVGGSIAAYYGQRLLFEAAAALAVVTRRIGGAGIGFRMCVDGSRNATCGAIPGRGGEESSPTSPRCPAAPVAQVRLSGSEKIWQEIKSLSPLGKGWVRLRE